MKNLIVLTLLITSAALLSCEKPTTTKEMTIAKVLRVKTCKGKRFQETMKLSKPICKDNKPFNDSALRLATVLKVKTCKGKRFQTVSEVL